MRQIKTFSDIRLDEMCSYCGKYLPETRDHVPSKILLEKPFPENLPVVPCCNKCNQEFSINEEYFACVLECILCGTTDINSLKRDKIIKILERKKNLKERIENSKRIIDEKIYFKIEEKRFENVITKLAKGHLKYENSTPILNNALNIWYKSINEMNNYEIETFFERVELTKLPEVGSRMLQNVLTDNFNGIYSQWITVQENIYYYSIIDFFGKNTIRIYIWNYLAIEVTFD